MQIIECELRRFTGKITARRMNKGPNFLLRNRLGNAANIHM